MFKRLFLKFFPVANANWLEIMIKNLGLRNELDISLVEKSLAEAEFLRTDLQCLLSDLRKSRFYVAYNSALSDKERVEVCERYDKVIGIVSRYVRLKHV